MNIKIIVDDLSDGKVIRLLEEHHQEMFQYSPPESVHALDRSKFFDKNLTFWSARCYDDTTHQSETDEIAACGALKELDSTHGEIKAMRTAKTYLRRGIAEDILKSIIAEAESRGYSRLSLETGAHKAFQPAVALYKKYGFVECEPFAGYQPDPNSIFLSKSWLIDKQAAL